MTWMAAESHNTDVNRVSVSMILTLMEVHLSTSFRQTYLAVAGHTTRVLPTFSCVRYERAAAVFPTPGASAMIPLPPALSRNSQPTCWYGYRSPLIPLA